MAKPDTESHSETLKGATNELVMQEAVSTSDNHAVNVVQEVDECQPPPPKRPLNGDSREDIDRDFKFSDRPTLEELHAMHTRFVRDRDWDQFHSPRNVLLALVGEVGELAELFQWRGECAVGLTDWSAKERTALEEELSDCLIYLLRLADRCRVDLPAAAVQKLAKNEAKYPIDKVFGSSKKYTEYQ